MSVTPGGRVGPYEVIALIGAGAMGQVFRAGDRRLNRHVVYGTLGSGLRWSRADGVGQSQVLLPSKSIQLPTSFTPDGARLAYFRPDGKEN